MDPLVSRRKDSRDQVAKLAGPGRVWLQSRSPGAFLDWLIPHLPKSKAGSGGD